MDQLRCNDGKCIPISWACDGFPDCDNEEDEDSTTCSTGELLEGVVYDNDDISSPDI